jgi:gamma-glutamyl-gamma-aminobutyrate hydrolase PuuD
LRHDYYPGFPRNTLAHSITIAQGSLLAPLFGAQLEVNSLHHQGIRTLAPNLLDIAHAPDGIIEAVALPDHPFGLAVQWHPEWLQEHESMRNLFCEFVKAARG